MELFEVGQKVKWKTGEIEVIAVVLEDTGEKMVKTITHFVGGSVSHRPIEVDREIVNKF